VMAVGDRYILRLFGTLAEVGVYSIGASFGLALKLALSAFEYAWAPFYYETMKQPDAKQTFTLVTTYGIGVLVLLEAGLAAIAHDVVRLMTTTEFYGAAGVIPWIGLGVVFNGVYLLTSIGLNITKSTKFYPVATAIAAGTSIGGNLVLVPRFGAMGAAWANAVAYAVLAVVAMRFSQRVYPVKYEWGRLARLAIAGGVAFALTLLIPPDVMPAWLGLLVRGSIVVAAYPLVLIALGFYDRRELALVGRLVSRGRRRQAAVAVAPVVAHEGAIESAGAIVDVPLGQDDEVVSAEGARSDGDGNGRESGRWPR
jgi:O-antigen/teichoic acid export membrane protein